MRRPGVKEKYVDNKKHQEYNKLYYIKNREQILAKKKEKYIKGKKQVQAQCKLLSKPRHKIKKQNRPTAMIDDWQKKILLQKYKPEELQNITMEKAINLMAKMLKK